LVKKYIALVLARAYLVAEYMALHAAKKGVLLTASCEESIAGDGVSITLTLYTWRTALDEEQTKKYLEKRLRALKHYLEFLQRVLERDGIRCEVRKRVINVTEEVPMHVVIHATFTPVRIDRAKLLLRPYGRKKLLYGTFLKVGGVRASFIKHLMFESEGEYERGAGGAHLEEVGGHAEEGGGEEGLQPAGAGGAGIGGDTEAGEGGGAGEGWVRLIDAATELGIPFLLLDSLVREGRMRAKRAVGPDGNLYTYVRLEEVKKLKEVLAGKREVREGGG